MNANQIADELENIYWVQGDGKGNPFQQYADFVRQQQAEIEALKQNIGQLVKPDLKIEEVMSEHCTCYKLGYSQLNDYAKVETK